MENIMLHKSSLYEVEKDIDIPPEYPGRRTKYPWTEMDIGDSFLVPDGTRKKLNTAVYAASRALKWKFVSRDVPGGVRIWRVK
jgi:hypothetical protein